MSVGASAECRIVRRRDPEKVRSDGWHELGIFAISVDDPKLTWPEREFIEQIGDRLYGKRRENGNGDGKGK